MVVFRFLLIMMFLNLTTSDGSTTCGGKVDIKVTGFQISTKYIPFVLACVSQSIGVGSDII
jgi:hypothetical protein